MSDAGRLEAVLEGWLDRCDRGEAVDVDQLVHEHPGLEAELRAHFANVDLVDAALGLAADEPPQPPEQVGDYRILRELGVGGMGTVYLAEPVAAARRGHVGQRVALKLIHSHLLGGRGFFKRVMREADIGKRVRHPNVVRTHDVDLVVEDGTPLHFLVMEYVEGQTLRDLLADLERVPEELCRHIAHEVTAALEAIHEAGAVHRDIKPENVLITREHVVKVMDLGVAALKDGAARLSQTGAFVGSIHYAAPEQFAQTLDIDARADLHALGVVLYELACGRHPYAGDDYRTVMRLILDDAPRRLGELNPQVSPFFEELVHRLLAKDREERFDSARELLAVLDEAERSTWWRERARTIRTATRRPLRRVRIPRETALYGRERELERLRALHAKASGGDGQVLLLEGEAGIGKTRLVDEFVARLVADGEDLNFLHASYPPGGAATASGAFSAAYREHLGEHDLENAVAEVLPQTPLLVPAFSALLRGDAAPAGVVALTKDSLQTCFVHATRGLGAERTTIVLIDDLHFAPEEGRALFSSVALAVPGHRILLIGTMRPGVPEGWTANVTRLDQTTHLQLPRLGPKDLIRLLQDSFQSERLAEELGVRIALKSDGNPFFVFEIIRGLREGQLITQQPDGTWVTTRIIEDIQIPSSVLDLVNARVADLGDDERNLLDVAACWGFEFDPLLIGDVLGIDRIPVLQLFGRIEKRHRLVRASGRRFVFDHHQVQEALYGALSGVLREEYHAALAEALEAREKAAEKDPETLPGALCVTLCEHYLAGGRGEAALRYLSAAQSHLTDGYLHAQVVLLSERALGVPGLLEDVLRAQALLRLAGVNGPLDLLGRRDRQEACAREAERLSEEAGDEERRGKAARALGSCLRLVSRDEEAEVALRGALEIARSRGDKKEEGAATGNLGLVFKAQGRFAEATAHDERALALAKEIGDRSSEAGTTVNLGTVFLEQGRLAEAKEHYERGLSLCREIGHRQFEATATGNLGIVFEAQGRLAEAKEHHERHLALGKEIGDRHGEARATGNLGIVFQLQGRLAEAKEHHERYLALSKEIGDRRGEAGATGNLGIVFKDQGRLAEANEHYGRYLALSREIGFRQGEAIALHSLAVVLREEGESAGCEERLLACLGLAEEIGFRYLVAHTQLALGSLRAARSLAAGSDGAGGWAALEAARDVAAKVGIRGVETLARCELALLRGGDAAGGGDAEDALAAFAEHGERLSAEERREARLLLYRSTGDRAHLEAAKRLLDEALANVPAEYHESMCRNLRVNREILAAWEA